MDEAIEIVTMGGHADGLADGLVVRRSAAERHAHPRRHAHDFHQVTLFLSGPGHVEWHFGERRAYSGRPSAGDVVVTPALVPTLVRWNRPFEAVAVRLSAPLLDRVADRSGLKVARLRPAAVRRDAFAGEVARTLCEVAESSGAGRELLAESLGTALAVHLLREYADDGPRPPGPGRLREEVLRRVTDHIEDHIDGNLSVDALAALAGLSPFHFSRLFRAATGTTPRQYVIGRRVELARRLIEDGCGIAQAAAQAGFSGQSHLHRHLRRLLGVTPGDLARRPRVGERPR